MNFGILTFLSDQKFDFFSPLRGSCVRPGRPAQTGKGLDSNKIKVIPSDRDLGDVTSVETKLRYCSYLNL